MLNTISTVRKVAAKVACRNFVPGSSKRHICRAIYKTRNTGVGNGMQGTRGMFTKIPGNLLEDSGECFHFSIPGNAREDSWKCSKRFQGMLLKISGNVRKDSGECFQKKCRDLAELI